MSGANYRMFATIPQNNYSIELFFGTRKSRVSSGNPR